MFDNGFLAAYQVFSACRTDTRPVLDSQLGQIIHVIFPDSGESNRMCPAWMACKHQPGSQASLKTQLFATAHVLSLVTKLIQEQLGAQEIRRAHRKAFFSICGGQSVEWQSKRCANFEAKSPKDVCAVLVAFSRTKVPCHLCHGPQG